MTISSRTPEGRPSKCVLCGTAVNLEFSEPAGDALCPKCGHLLWRSAQLFERLQLSLSEALSVPQSDIEVDSHFADDLRADSLDVVELVMAFEDELGVTIPDDDYEQIRTIGDAVRYIEKRQRDG